MALSSGARAPSLSRYEGNTSFSSPSPNRFLIKLPTLSNPIVVASGLSGANSDPRRRRVVASTAVWQSGSSHVLHASSYSRCNSNNRRGALLPSRDEFFVGSNKIVLSRQGSLPGHNKGGGFQFYCRSEGSFVHDGAILEDVPHLSAWMPDLPSYPNPLKDNPAYTAVRQYFVEEDDVVAKNIVVKFASPSQGVYFRRAGPRENVVFKGEEVRACIVTCGGLCPGLNTVIREIVCGLWTSYGVRDIIGIQGGYAGFYSSNTRQLNPRVVNDIHKKGGTILGTSRGGHDKTKIVAAILDRGINQVYIIGGDGTQRGAAVISEELKKLGVKVVVAGIPKTIDNDIAVIDKSFGFDTAVEEAQRAINAAHVEAESVKNGVGVVKLMGRYSGYIAMYATLASRDVDCCLIPEVPFYLDGKGGLYEFVRTRLKENGHMVIVLAEGAGQELIAESKQVNQIDASGNRLLLDVGLWLCQNLKDHFSANKKEALTVKYIDPTYMVRAIPSNASDNVYSTLLAHSAMHGAMAGYTGFTVGPVNGRHAYIPILTVVETQNRVNVTDRMWARLLSSTQQPDFLDYAHAMEKTRQKNTEKAAVSNSSVAQQSNGSFRDQTLVESNGEVSGF